MNRRSLLKKSIASGIIGMLPMPALLANEKNIATSTNDNKLNKFRQIKLGDLELTILTDGFIKQSPVYPFVAPLATEAAVNNLLVENFRPTDYVELSMNIMVVKSKDKLILLDTGMAYLRRPHRDSC